MRSVKRTVIRSPQSASAPINFPQHEFSAQLRIHKTSLLCVTLVENENSPKSRIYWTKKAHLKLMRPIEAILGQVDYLRPFEAI